MKIFKGSRLELLHEDPIHIHSCNVAAFLNRNYMKVLQTIGARAGQQPGIFQYKRTPEGVHIDSSVGQTANPSVLNFSSEEWDDLLSDLNGKTVYTLSELKDVIDGNFRRIYPDFNGSDAACIAAILEHEGSIDHYGGTSGPSQTVTINLRRDF